MYHYNSVYYMQVSVYLGIILYMYKNKILMYKWKHVHCVYKCYSCATCLLYVVILENMRKEYYEMVASVQSAWFLVRDKLKNHGMLFYKDLNIMYIFCSVIGTCPRMSGL